MANIITYDYAKTSCSWIIYDLDTDFNTNNYISAGAATSPVEFGSINPPSGVKGSVGAPPPPGEGNYAIGTATGLSPGTTYTLYGYAQSINGKYYPAGSHTFTTLPENPRPSNFSWTYPKTSGGDLNLTATEWNSFTARINAFRTYKGLTTILFTSAVSGNNFTATMFNQARTALSAMVGSLPPAQSSGSDVYAVYLNSLVSQMNSID